MENIWTTLINRGSELVDTLGRNTASNTTAFGNSIATVILASKGINSYAPYGYADPEPRNYTPLYIISACVFVLIVFLIVKK